MKKLKHVWKYLTNTTYRFYVDLQTSQDALDANMNRILEEKHLSSFPPIVADFSRREGISPEHAQAILKAQKRI